MKRQVAGVVALTLLASHAHAAGFTPLGYLVESATHSVATGVSADGSVVVGHGTSSLGIEEAFRWTRDGGMTGLGDLTGGQFWSVATGVSADGTVVTGDSESSGYGANTHWQGFTWRNGTGMVPMGFPAGANTMFTHGISSDGSIVVSHAVGVSSPGRPPYFAGFRWTSSEGYVELGFFPGGISGDGSTIVGEGLINGDQAVYWTADAGIVLLGHLAGYSDSSKATAASVDGAVIVGSEYGSDGLDMEAFRWTAATGMTSLGFLPGRTRSGPSAISGDGTIAVGSSFTNWADDREAFIWTETGGIQRLLDVLLANGVTGLDGWTLSDALDISDDGQWVTGYGLNPRGHEEAFLANISPDTDGDGQPDPIDNCTLIANPSHLDTDGDGYGNLCDGDLNNSGLTTATDFNLLRSCLNQPATASALCAAADMNGSGLVTSADFNLLRARLNTAPGPSGFFP